MPNYIGGVRGSMGGNTLGNTLNFLIIVTGWECKPYIRACYDSLLKQTYTNWQAVFLSDGPKDGSDQELRCIVRDRRCLVRTFKDNVGAAKRRYDALQEFGEPTDVVLLLGMDDALTPGCLARVKREYDAGKWMSYGNWRTPAGKTLPEGFLHFPEEVHRDRSYRSVQYRSTAPNTFYKFLFSSIPAEDFIINGKWIDSTTESEVMFSCLEMCGHDRIGIIEEPIYIYNAHTAKGTLRRQGADYKYKLLEIITARPARDLLEENDFGMGRKKKKAEDAEDTNNTITPPEGEQNNSTNPGETGGNESPPKPSDPVFDNWKQRAQNLIDRRATGMRDNARTESVVADYGRHLRASQKHGAGIGAVVLDVGCGDMNLRAILEQHTQYSGSKHQYIGIDAFPVSDEAQEMMIESCALEDKSVDTAVVFAVLDGCYDLEKACEQLRRVSRRNVLILTGVGIEPDQYHTIMIDEAALISAMAPWRVSLKNYLTPKVMLIEFVP